MTPPSGDGSIAAAVQLVLGHHKLDAPGGSESYLITVAEHLQRLGHDVAVYTDDPGAMAHVAAGRGLRVVTAVHELSDSCDGVLAQDAAASLSLADRYPHAPQLFVAHAPTIDLQRPVQLDDVVSAVVVLSDRVARRLEGLAKRHEFVRLRQPVDLQRFFPREAPRRQASRVLLLSNYHWGAAREVLDRACGEAGMRLEQVGLPARVSTTPELEIAACDITVGTGRAALEAMASGRGVYVMDRYAGDGWVTPSSYPTFESNGFGGNASDDTIDGARLRRDLAAFDPEMGVVNRQLAFKHHHAMEHARELVELLRRLAPEKPRARGPLEEMARLVRVQWQTESRAVSLARENAALRAELEHAEADRARVEQDARAVHAQLDQFRRTRRYRLARLMGRPLDALRRRGR